MCYERGGVIPPDAQIRLNTGQAETKTNKQNTLIPSTNTKMKAHYIINSIPLFEITFRIMALMKVSFLFMTLLTDIYSIVIFI